MNSYTSHKARRCFSQQTQISQTQFHLKKIQTFTRTDSVFFFSLCQVWNFIARCVRNPTVPGHLSSVITETNTSLLLVRAVIFALKLLRIRTLSSTIKFSTTRMRNTPCTDVRLNFRVYLSNMSERIQFCLILQETSQGSPW